MEKLGEGLDTLEEGMREEEGGREGVARVASCTIIRPKFIFKPKIFIAGALFSSTHNFIFFDRFFFYIKTELNGATGRTLNTGPGNSGSLVGAGW